MEKSETENVQRNRLEKDEKHKSVVVTLDDSTTVRNRENLVTATTTSSGTEHYKTKTCYLLTKTNSSVAINIPAKDIRLSGVSSTSCAQMSIINVSSSKDNPVFICCFQAKKKESGPDKEPTSESQISLRTGITSDISQVNVIASANSCSQEPRTNQPDIVDYMKQDLQTSTSLTAGHLIATGGKTDSDSTTISHHFWHRPKDERINTTGNQFDINVEEYDPLEKNCVESKIPHECQKDQVDHSKSCTIQTTQMDKQLSDVQTSHDTIQSTFDGDSKNNLLEKKVKPYTTSECTTGQVDDFETQPSQPNTIRQSIFKPVSKHGTTENSCFKPHTINDHHHQVENRGSQLTSSELPRCDYSTYDTINDNHQAKNRSPPSSPRTLTFRAHSTHVFNNCHQVENRSSPSTPTKKFSNHITTNTKQSLLDDCYLDTGSWDPLCHHIEYHERNMTLPRDLRYLKSSELLPMAYGDFTKCLEDEDLCCAPPEMITSGDDDGVVPSSSPLLPGDEPRCCSDTSTDANQEYTWECFSERDETIYKSPSLSYTDYPQYGTLNWGLSPTIIYKTPEPDTSLKDVGNDYMKCSISAGNVELLTPPPPNYKKLLRRSRRRMERRYIKKRRIYFGNKENCQGLQEVPVNESEKDTDLLMDTDFVPDDPMWFEDEPDESDLIDDSDKQISVKDQDVTDCYEYVSSNSEETTDTCQILADVAEYIKNLEETPAAVTGLNVDCDENSEPIQDEEPVCKDALEVLPQLSWDEIDDSSLEIQEILNGLSVPEEETNVEDCELEPPDSFRQEEQNEEPNKRKQNKIVNIQQSTSNKRKKSLDDSTQLDKVAQYWQGDENLRNDCEYVPLSAGQIFEDSTRPSLFNRNNSQASRCVTPISPRTIPGVLVSPSAFIPLQSIGKPMILPKPPQGDCFSSPIVRSPLISPQVVSTIKLIPSACSVQVSEAATLTQFCPDVTSPIRTRSQRFGSPVMMPAQRWMPLRKCRTRSRNKEKYEHKCGVGKGSQEKCIPNGYMLYCKKRRNHVLRENPDLKSKPGDITKLLSENWKQLSEEEQRPYVEEAMKLRCDEKKWINKTP